MKIYFWKWMYTYYPVKNIALAQANIEYRRGTGSNKFWCNPMTNYILMYRNFTQMYHMVWLAMYVPMTVHLRSVMQELSQTTPLAGCNSASHGIFRPNNTMV